MVELVAAEDEDDSGEEKRVLFSSREHGDEALWCSRDHGDFW